MNNFVDNNTLKQRNINTQHQNQYQQNQYQQQYQQQNQYQQKNQYQQQNQYQQYQYQQSDNMNKLRSKSISVLQKYKKTQKLHSNNNNNNSNNNNIYQHNDENNIHINPKSRQSLNNNNIKSKQQFQISTTNKQSLKQYMQKQQINKIKKNRYEQSILISIGKLPEYLNNLIILDNNNKKHQHQHNSISIISQQISQISINQTHMWYIQIQSSRNKSVSNLPIIHYQSLSSSYSIKQNQKNLKEFFHSQNIMINKIFSTPYSTFFITENQQLYAVGLNDRGQLGISNNNNSINNNNNNNYYNYNISNNNSNMLGIINISQPKKVNSMSKHKESINNININNININKQLSQKDNNKLIRPKSMSILSSLSKQKISKQQQQYNHPSTSCLLHQDQQIIQITGGPFHTVILTSYHRIFYSGTLFTSEYLLNDKFISTFTEISLITNNINTLSTEIRLITNNNISSYIPIKSIISTSTSIFILTISGHLYVMGLIGEQIFYDKFTDIQCFYNDQNNKVKQFCVFNNDVVLIIDEKNSIYQIDMKRKVLKLNKINPIINNINNNNNNINNKINNNNNNNNKINNNKDNPLQITKIFPSLTSPPIFQLSSHQNNNKSYNSPTFYHLTTSYNLNQFTQLNQIIQSSNLQQQKSQQIKINNIICKKDYILVLIKGNKEGILKVKRNIKKINMKKNNQINQSHKNNNNVFKNSQLDLNQNDLKNIMKKIKQLQQDNQTLKKQLQTQKLTQKSNKTKSIQIQTQSSQQHQQLPNPPLTSKLTFPFKQPPQLPSLKYQPRTFQNSLQINFNQIKLGKKIAQGGYGIIYKGQWRKTQIAIKIFKIQQNNHTAIKDFISQCHAMESLRHPNIVMFLGACVKGPHFAIILQYCQNGTLWSMLQNKKTSLPWCTRINYAIQISRAMTYLHDRPHPIVHRDLKSLNILLTQNNKIKLADFGWTKGLTNYMTSKIGTYQWMAPEVVSTQEYTQKADVYSFGIILWEIASRQPPYRNIQGIQVAYDVVNKGLRPQIPDNVPENYQKLMVKCWDKQPTKRPSFKQIIEILQNQIQQLKKPQNI